MILNNKYDLHLEDRRDAITVNLVLNGLEIPIFRFTLDGRFERTKSGVGIGGDFVSDLFVVNAQGQVMCGVGGKGGSDKGMVEPPEYMMLTNNVGLGLLKERDDILLALVDNNGELCNSGYLLHFWCDGRVDREAAVRTDLFSLNSCGQLEITDDSEQ